MRPLQTPAAPSGATYRLARSLALFLTLTFAALLHAADAAKVTFDLPAESAEKALKRFSEQSGQEVLFASDLAKGIKCNPVHGEMTPADALNAMLSDTGLVAVQEAKSGAFSVRRESLDEAKNVNRAVAETAKSGRPARTDSSDTYSNAQGEQVLKLPEYLVTGAKTLNADIQRTRDDIQPYVVLNRDEIIRSGSINLEDFLKTRLPMNTQTATLDQNLSPNTIAEGGINLRGLGRNQTLILIDGRHIASGAPSGGDFRQPLVSGIPLASVERIEVLPATGGAIYGGNATGGVINIIRKRDYVGLDLQVNYGNSFDTDVGRTEYNLSGGTSFNHGNTQLSFSLSHSDAHDLLAVDRDFAARSRNLLFVNNSSVVTSNTRALGSLTNIARVQSTAPLTLDNGQQLSAPYTFIPRGYAGPTSDAGAALAANAGNFDLGTPSMGDYLLRSPTQNSFSVDVRQIISPSIEAYLSSAGGRTVSNLASPIIDTTFAFSAADPLNPFQQPVNVTIPLAGIVFPGKAKAETLQVVGGVIARLPSEWNLTLEYGRSRSTNSSVYHDSPSIAGALSSTGVTLLRSLAFQDLANHPIDLRPYLATEPDSFSGPYTNTLDSYSMRGAGPSVRLPAGPLNVTILAEHRRERSDTAYVSVPDFAQQAFPQSQSVNSGYVEATVPLFSPQSRTAFAEKLDFQLSLRHDEYVSQTAKSATADTVAGPFAAPVYATSRLKSTNYLLGFRFQPVHDAAFRASYGTGFLPPGLSQFSPAPSSNIASTQLLDPRRGNTTVSTPYTRLQGGNPDLKPERSRSLTVGLVLTPSVTPGLRLSVDYTRIRKDDEIVTPNDAFILANEATFPDRVVRGPNLATDQPGWAGPVRQINSRTINFLSSSVEAVDVQADYSWTTGNLGSFTIAAIATQMRTFTRQLSVTNARFDSVGFDGGPLKLRLNSSVRWERGAWQAGWSVQFYDSYLVTSNDPSTPASLNATKVKNQGSPRIPSQIYHDAFVSYKLGRSRHALLDNVSFTVGVQNIFNASPPIIAASNVGNVPSGYSPFGDPRLQRYTLAIQKSFGL